MSVEAILAAIEAGGEAEVAQLRSETEAQVRHVLAEAGRAASVRKQDAFREAMRPASGEKARRLHRAKLEALCAISEIRDRLVDEALAQTRDRLAVVRRAPEYPRILHRLTDEVIGALGDESAQDSRCQLEIDPRDEALLPHIVSKLRLEVGIACTLDCWGGLIARSGDGRIVAINTVEARLERALPLLRRELAAHFEKGCDARL
jgi:vacuolar-type H+-ATPase subunit E/Vma4